MKHWLTCDAGDDSVFNSFDEALDLFADRIEVWEKAYPQLAKYPPIYWSGVKWVWRSPDEADIQLYRSICEGLIYAITRQSRVILNRSNGLLQPAVHLGRKRSQRL